MVAIYRFRFLTLQLATWVFFLRRDGDSDRRSSLAAHQLQMLYEAGYTQRLILPTLPGAGRSPAIYALTSRGADAVAARVGLDRARVDWRSADNRATAFFMEHTLAIARLWASVHAALRDEEIKLGRWTGERELLRMGVKVRDLQAGRWIPLRPDGYFEVRRLDKTFMPFFVEVDMGTETNARFAGKVRLYRAYRLEASFRKSSHADSRVLVVTSGARRLDNLRRITRRVSEKGFCYFGVLEDLRPDRVLSAWVDIDGERIDLRDL